MKKLITIVFLIVSSAVTAHPQNETETAEIIKPSLNDITLDEAIVLAEENSIEIKKTQVRIQDNETRLSEENVWNWLRPNVSVSGGMDINTGEPRLSLGFGVDLRDVTGAGKKRIRTIKYSISEERKNLEALNSAVKIRVTGAYKAYRNAKEKIGLLEETLKNDERLFAEAGAKGTDIEKLMLRSMLNQDRLALLSAREDFEQAETELRDLIGLAP